MKKLFISQPMAGKTDEEIKRERETALATAVELIGEPVELIDSFFEDCDHLNHPLEFLGESLKKLAKADVAYFVYGWERKRGCSIEHACAEAYGILSIVEIEGATEHE